LTQLARFAPQIFGRALTLDGVTRALVASSGRSDRLDGHTPELRQALAALAALQQLATQGEEGILAARVLAYTHVVCGEAARGLAATWVQVGLMARPRKKVLSAHQREVYSTLGLVVYHYARQLWDAL
jgi:hypothetical protein